jgi:hypothetical protein
MRVKGGVPAMAVVPDSGMTDRDGDSENIVEIPLSC